jgi:hypothetical protein
MLDLYRIAKAELGVSGTHFLRAIGEHGDVETAHRLLLRNNFSVEGRGILWTTGRPEFVPLYSEEE